jgi:hypothetical protein
VSACVPVCVYECVSVCVCVTEIEIEFLYNMYRVKPVAVFVFSDLCHTSTYNSGLGREPP